MRAAVPLLLASLIVPQPGDAWRFNLPVLPATTAMRSSDVRNAWRFTAGQLDYWQRRVKVYGAIEPESFAALCEAAWRYDVWYHVDDLCDSSKQMEYRQQAAVRLRNLIGPVDYAAGRLPTPWIP